MTSISKNVYIDKLDHLVHKDINTSHKNEACSCKVGYIDFDVENNDKNPTFKVGANVRILKYKNIFLRSHVKLLLYLN